MNDDRKPAMRVHPVRLARRLFFARSAAIAGTAVLTALVGPGKPAIAKTAKGDVMYQDHQHDGKSCSQCKFFAPDGSNSNRGSCEVVAGVVSREGWCTVFSAKGAGRP